MIESDARIMIINCLFFMLVDIRIKYVKDIDIFQTAVVIICFRETFIREGSNDQGQKIKNNETISSH